MRSSRLVAALLALLFALVAAFPPLAAPTSPSAWAWGAVVGCIGLGFLTLVFLIPPAHY